MATVRQINANQQNSLKSTGPKTPEGKAVSRANSLQHGLSGEGIVFPDEERAEIATRVEQWNASVRPDTPADQWLVNMVATEAVRVERCRAIEAKIREEEARRAGETWDEDRRLAAAKLATKLSKRPEVVALELATTTQGLDLLLDRWRTLGIILETGDWNDAQRSLALDLLGIAPDQRDAINPLMIATRPGGIGLAQLVSDQVEKLLLLKPILDARDGREQSSAMIGMGGFSAELNRIHRYEAACLRRFQWAYKRLKSIPSTPASTPSPSVPLASAPPLLVNGCLADSFDDLLFQDDENMLLELEALETSMFSRDNSSVLAGCGSGGIGR